jgi:predicted transglutaminase-like cysteine proteinase
MVEPVANSLIRLIVMLVLVTGCSGGSTPPAEPAKPVDPAVQEAAQNAASKDGDYFAKQRLLALKRLIASLKGKTELEKLEGVNDFFNRVRFVPDIETWGVKDYWARPTEFLTRDQGDCEDFVIAKFFTLKQLGVPESKLFFTYVKALKLNQAHMVLTYYATPKSVPLVLDNLNYRVLPADQRKDLVYVYSFNAGTFFLNTQRGRGRTIEGGAADNKKWAAFLKRIEKDGL